VAAIRAVTVEQLIHLAVLFSVMLIVLSFALRATWREAISLFRNPSLLLRSLLAMNVLLPVFAATLVGLFTFRPAIEIALITLAVAPVPPFLPQRQLKIVGHNEYVYGLLLATSLLSVVLAPLTVTLIGLAFSRHTHIAPLVIARIVALTVLIPFALGLIINQRIPAFAERASPLAGRAGVLLLAAAVVPVLIKMWPGIISLIGDGTLLAFIGFVAVGLVVGHLLGGADPVNRTVLALATSTRHPAVALVIATGIFPGDKFVAPALVLYLLVATIGSVPYVMWRSRQRIS
jgi:BASS family bile acid:Na+ symporter